MKALFLLKDSSPESAQDFLNTTLFEFLQTVEGITLEKGKISSSLLTMSNYSLYLEAQLPHGFQFEMLMMEPAAKKLMKSFGEYQRYIDILLLERN